MAVLAQLALDLHSTLRARRPPLPRRSRRTSVRRRGEHGGGDRARCVALWPEILVADLPRDTHRSFMGTPDMRPVARQSTTWLSPCGPANSAKPSAARAGSPRGQQVWD